MSRFRVLLPVCRLCVEGDDATDEDIPDAHLYRRHHYLVLGDSFWRGRERC